MEHISLDGVIQGPGGPTEDDYRYGGWAAAHDDPEGGEAIVAAHGDDFDLLLGRRVSISGAAFGQTPRKARWRTR